MLDQTSSNHFLFYATFEDGTQLVQNQDDVSSSNPEKNCLFDVFEYQKKSKLISFVLFGSHDGQNNVAYGVDLRDGHFEVMGIPFWPYRNDREVYQNFEIIYLRNNRIDKNLETGITVHSVGYTVGYKAEKILPKPKEKDKKIYEFIIKF